MTNSFVNIEKQEMNMRIRSIAFVFVLSMSMAMLIGCDKEREASQDHGEVGQSDQPGDRQDELSQVVLEIREAEKELSKLRERAAQLRRKSGDIPTARSTLTLSTLAEILGHAPHGLKPESIVERKETLDWLNMRLNDNRIEIRSCDIQVFGSDDISPHEIVPGSYLARFTVSGLPANLPIEIQIGDGGGITMSTLVATDLTLKQIDKIERFSKGKNDAIIRGKVTAVWYAHWEGNDLERKLESYRPYQLIFRLEKASAQIDDLVLPIEYYSFR